ncbi:MAG TPA: NADPH:quinone reductase [Elusimicrobia bacterium]|nr:NADPH:quinone reductase [Elusimicrobiota bacterium]HBT62995.1 NADPH:quinone reductase [Elusimicrobiota bacterium]
MRAVRMNAYGGPDVLAAGEARKPEPGVGEVLIRVCAAGVNPVDWKLRAGYFKERIKRSFPLIPGWDVSGVVEAVGGGVEDFKIGDEVFGKLDFARDGAYAEYVAARARDLARKPRSFDHVHAAAVPLAALTAWQSLFDVGNLYAGQTILIHAAAGGVGHFAVQLAKWKGARVIATVSAANAEFARALGADEVIDYQKTRFEEAAKAVDLVLDTIGGDTQQRSYKSLKRGGTLISTVGITSAPAAAEHGVRCESVMVRSDGKELAQIAELIDAGRLRVDIQTVLPLSQAATAQELSQMGHVRGKIVLKVGD